MYCDFLNLLVGVCHFLTLPKRMHFTAWHVRLVSRNRVDARCIISCSLMSSLRWRAYADVCYGCCDYCCSRVTDFFQGVQLNINNPHFLIMQGRITKVGELDKGLFIVKLAETKMLGMMVCRYLNVGVSPML